MITRRSLAATVAAVGLVGLAATVAQAAPTVGQPAPAFTGTDTAGNSHSLEAFRGQTVVLEWTNHECPYVRKHYGSGNMQALQEKWTGEGVVWLSVVSSAPGQQGHVDAEAGTKVIEAEGAKPTAKILDPDGTIGRAYGARTTPHMYIIDAEGTLVYMGGIDDKPTANPADIDGATNFVDVALTELASGQAISTPVSRPYGCSVKYVN